MRQEGDARHKVYFISTKDVDTKKMKTSSEPFHRTYCFNFKYIHISKRGIETTNSVQQEN